MFATVVIGLREGLEAVLIVGIIALFLRRRGSSLKPMAAGVALAIAVSIGVAVVLQLTAQSLPQQQQEALEAIIGALTVIMVTTMILWMRTHAKNLKGELETAATQALGQGSAIALAAMAFLAVLKEGVETSFFLLAAYQSATSPLLATLGAVIGIAAAVILGVLFFRGAIKINLGRFFSISAIFLVLVAGGILVNAFRGAVAAGWFHFGQTQVADLSWLMPYGSIHGALFSGILGIPADVRVLDITVWLLYVVPVLLACTWPRRAGQPAATRVRTLRIAAATLGALALLVAGAATLTLALRAPIPLATDNAGQVSFRDSTLMFDGDARQAMPASNSPVQSANAVPLASQGSAQVEGLDGTLYAPAPSEGSAQPSDCAGVSETGTTRVSLDEIADANGGRLPLGLNSARTPGPFQATLSCQDVTQAWVVDGQLIRAQSTHPTTLALSGGGLAAPKTVSVTGQLAGADSARDSVPSKDWHSTDSATAEALEWVNTTRDIKTESPLWLFVVPGGLALSALAALLAARRARRSDVSRQ